MPIIHKLVSAALLLALMACTSCEKAPDYAGLYEPKSPVDLKAHAAIFKKRIEKVGERVYLAIGYALANSIMVEVEGGKVIVDCTESVVAAKEIKAEFDKLVPGPVKAIIYTHSHPDHVLGSSVFHQDAVPIWAHEASLQAMNDQFASLADTLRYRGHKQFGEGLSEKQRISNGIGPFLRLDPGPVPPLLYPTQTFTGIKKLEFGGVKFELHQAPGETHEQLFVWLPESKTLLPGDNFYQAFPNLYSTRGVPPRPVRGWIRSIDAMRALKPEFVAPSHTGPLAGKELIEDTMRSYRDAIRYIHDSVIRLANEGKRPADMVEQIRLPPHLKEHPFLQEFYGRVSWSVRGIYDGYLGWFDGNPTSLYRLHPRTYAQKMLPLMGGPEKVKAAIEIAIKEEQMQWAMELSDMLLSVDPLDAFAREAKSRALTWSALRDSNPNARCFMLTTALELQERYEAPGKPIIDANTLMDVPIEVILKTFPERVKPLETADKNMCITFDFTDSGKHFTFRIRQGVGEVSEGLAPDPDLAFSCTEKDYKSLLTQDISAYVKLATGGMISAGGVGELMAFRSYLIKP